MEPVIVASAELSHAQRSVVEVASLHVLARAQMLAVPDTLVSWFGPATPPAWTDTRAVVAVPVFRRHEWSPVAVIGAIDTRRRPWPQAARGLTTLAVAVAEHMDGFGAMATG